MTPHSTAFYSVALLLGLTTMLVPQRRQQKKPAPTASALQTTVAPIIHKFCFQCHSGAMPAAGLSLEKALTSKEFAAATWQKVATNVGTRHMPPMGVPHPTPAQRAVLIKALDALQTDCRLADPGHVTIRRLNRQEYNNTIRDLIGLDLHPADDFPSDDVGYGFDNIGDVLSISPLLMEKYLNAAERIATAAIILPGVHTVHKDGADLNDGSASTNREANEKILYSECEVDGGFKISTANRYKVRVLAYGEQAGPEPVRMAVRVDGKDAATFTVPNKSAKPFEVPVQLGAGQHAIGAAFLNDYYNPQTKADRNLIVTAMELVGPLDGNGPLPESHIRIIPRQPSHAEWTGEARKDIARFAGRAFRRPVTSDELDRLLKVFQAGAAGDGSYESGMRIAVEAVLISPRFLFRVELDPRSSDGKKRTLTDYELASRLSYFLWSSMPDSRLFSLANSGTLHQPAVLHREIYRMLGDPKSQALSDNFAEQWLQLRKLDLFVPDRQQFPEVDTAMKRDMATETKLFFNAVVQNDRSVIDFLDGNYSYLNNRLASMYGIKGIDGPEFRLVPLKDDNRRGILTQAAVLSVTSNPTRTSPTKRGKWILEQVLGTPPPPPPPGVGTIKDEKTQLNATTLRKLMEEHRKNPMCASCHAQMDPIGFGLENFDPVGRWRTKEGPFPVDATGLLPDGRKFNGPVELRKILLQQKDQFVHTLSEKLLTYALGRGVTPNDKCNVDDVVVATKKNGYRFGSMIEAIIKSDAFRSQGKPTTR